MTWTYSTSTGLTDNKDRVRLLIGDTNTNDQLLSDEEINYLTGINGTVQGMASDACLAIAAKFSRFADEAVGPLRYDFNQRAKEYQSMAKTLRVRAIVLVAPSAGGITISGKEDLEGDTDRVAPGAARGQFADRDATNDARYSDFGSDGAN